MAYGWLSAAFKGSEKLLPYRGGGVVVAGAQVTPTEPKIRVEPK